MTTSSSQSLHLTHLWSSSQREPKSYVYVWLHLTQELCLESPHISPFNSQHHCKSSWCRKLKECCGGVESMAERTATIKKQYRETPLSSTTEKRMRERMHVCWRLCGWGVRKKYPTFSQSPLPPFSFGYERDTELIITLQ